MASLYSEDDRYDETFFSNYAIINMQNPLARIQGVGQIRIFGAGPYSMRVWLDPKRLQTFGLTTADVLAAIRGQNIEVVSGQIGGPPVPENQAFQFTINALGRLSDASQFEGITIKSASGTAPAARAPARRRPGGAEPAELQQLLAIHRSQGGADRGVRPAGRQRHPGRRSRLRGRWPR